MMHVSRWWLAMKSSIVAGTGSEPPDQDIVSPDRNSFLVSFSPIDAMYAAIKSKSHVYMKGGVHSGKTSWAISFASDPKNKAVYIPCNDCHTGKEDEFMGNLLGEIADGSSEHFKKVDPGRSFTLKTIPNDHILIFDECQTLFNYYHSKFTQAAETFIKRNKLKAKVVYLSTTDRTKLPNGKFGTPPQISNKYQMKWNFTREEVADLIPCMLEGKITATSVDDDVVDLIYGLFAGHRGMTTCALAAISEDFQADSFSKQQDLTISTCHRLLSGAFGQGRGALSSRAVQVNGGLNHFMESLTEAERTVVQAVTIQGNVPSSILDKLVPEITARLVTLGILEPLGKLSSTPASKGALRLQDTLCYQISNPFLRQKLSAGLNVIEERVAPSPMLPVEAILTGVSNIDLTALFGPGFDGTLHNKDIFYEEQINSAIMNGARSIWPTHGIGLTFGGSDKPDMVMSSKEKRFVIEFVLKSSSDFKTHYSRFFTKGYLPNPNDLGLLVIYCRTGQLSFTDSYVKTVLDPRVPILVVVVDFSSLWEFKTVYYERKTPKSQVKKTETKVPLNLSVFQRKQPGGSFTPSQTFTAAFEKKFAAVRDTDVGYWVSVTGAGFPKGVVTNVFAVLQKELLGKDIDGLKEAVLKKFPKKLQGKDVSDLTVYPPGEKKDGKAAITTMSTPLESSSEDAPYHVEVK